MKGMKEEGGDSTRNAGKKLTPVSLFFCRFGIPKGRKNSFAKKKNFVAIKVFQRT